MESTPPTSKRVQTKAVRSGGRLEGWCSGDNDLIEKYRYETSIKKINSPKVVCFDWLKSQKLDNVRRLLKDQSQKVPRDEGKHISRFGEGILHQLEV